MGTSVNQTPRREIKACNVINLWALNYDGVNDYLLNDPSTPYTEFEYTQPFTFFIKYITSATFCFSTYSGGNTGFSISVGASASSIDFNSGASSFDRTLISYTATDPMTSTYVIQATSDGTARSAGISFYINGVAMSVGTVFFNAITSSMINGQSKVYSMARRTGSFVYGTGSYIEMSMVDYVKTGTELTADYNNGSQSVGVGSWLLNPVRPVYPQPIQTLNSANPFFDVNANLEYNIFGKPATMDLETDFELIPG